MQKFVISVKQHALILWELHHSDPVCFMCSPDVVLMLGQRHRRWPNIKPTLGQHIVLAGLTFFGETVHRETTTEKLGSVKYCIML